MSSTPNRFTRYDAEHHDPATEYVLASEHDAQFLEHYCRIDVYASDNISLRMERDRLRSELEAAQAQLAALSYPVQLHTNPLLTVESGGIRYVLEAMSDEDGDWFEVKSATPTEAQTLDDFAHSARPARTTGIAALARQALAAYRAAQREDDEASRAC